ncbi:MAG: (2Fe-2S)-binding protein [Spirochaetes bacterium]|nr:(2Fe-2S)-binding protein [Spirochaetota bacterium]
MGEKYVNITINGAKIKAVKGATVLDTALDYGICIPHLCHMHGISPIGACRLCIVEVIENNKSKVVTSCTLDVKEGLVIQAHSEKILKARKNIAEMLVAEAPNSRAIQDIAARCGVTKVRYPFRHNDCILCGKCVRVCSEVWQSKSLGFVGRGKSLHVALPFNVRPDTCKMCLTCVDICPMTITPCPGPMKEGEEYLCNQCISQLSMEQDTPDTCISCRLGEGFNCIRAEKT